MNYRITHELNSELIWSLRALAQDAHNQRDLYPPFVCVADELVSDFGFAYDCLSDCEKAKYVDLMVLDKLILEKSGILEYWTEEALNYSSYWNDIRALARSILKEYGISAFTPHSSTSIYVGSPTDE